MGLLAGGSTGATFLKLADETDWVMRPVLAHLISYDRLLDGSVGLVDIARMNDALDIQYENQRRADEAAQNRR